LPLARYRPRQLEEHGMTTSKQRLVRVNQVPPEVGDGDEALRFFGSVFPPTGTTLFVGGGMFL
jgi:hypothetical protein